jgi:hypothetical protein
MAEHSIQRIVAEITAVKGAPGLLKKAIELAESLDVPLEMKGYAEPGEADNAAMISLYLEQLKKMQELLSSSLKEAEKKNIRSRAAVLASIKQEKDTSSLHIIQMDRWLPDELMNISLIHFERSRTRKYLEKSVIVAESDLSPLQKEHFVATCAALSKLGSVPEAVLIQGKSNLNHWEALFKKTCMKNATVHMLSNEDEFPVYLKKTKVRMICVPNHSGQTSERLEALHKINRSDILLF